MGKKNMKLLPSSPPPWQWPSCGNLKTISFRCSDDTVFRMANSTFAIDPPPDDTRFTSSDSSLADSSEEEGAPGAGDPLESVIRGLSSERLFFEPGETSSILDNRAKIEKQKNSRTTMDDDDGDGDGPPYKESEIVSMDSEDPYGDFRRSMEEMVQAHGMKDWAGLEDLLSWYLRVNGKANHGYIVGAFIDLLVGLSFAEFTAEGSSTSSASSSFTISHSSLPSSPLSLPSSLSVPTPSSSQPLDPGDDDDGGDNVIQESTSA